MKSKIKRITVFAVLVVSILSLSIYALKEVYIPRSVPVVEEYTPWDPELVELVASLPVQEGGRVKPFSTWAMYRLYSIHSGKNVKIKVDGKTLKLSPTEWMLDSMFRPDVANALPTFRIEDSHVAEALKIKTAFTNEEGDEVTKKRADYYSYDEIENPEFIEEYSNQQKENLKLLGDGKVPKGFEAHKSNLIASIGNFRQQTYFLQLTEFFLDDVYYQTAEGKLAADYSDEKLKQSLEGFVKESFVNMKGAIMKGNEEVKALWSDSEFLELRMHPPTDNESVTWISYNTAMKDLMLGEPNYESERYAFKVVDTTKTFSRWLYLAHSYKSGGQKGLLTAFKDLQSEVKKTIDVRGESLSKVESELSYYKRKYFAWAMGFFYLGLICVLGILPAPAKLSSKILGYLAGSFALIGSGYIIAGLIHRWIIMGRYPLGKLYDTILLITAVSVLILLFMELLSRRKLCLAVAVTMGLIGMFLAGRFDVGNGQDTLAPLQAVLNSDYWLITHVNCITIGYAGGLVAAFISVFYILSRITGIDDGDKDFRRSVTRVAYGAACFTLVFSLVGTVLGGIWANDSWGRFWGWDPKENGALMIVLWYLGLLHARLAGYIKEWGIHICMVLGAIIIAFSWWGVNFLATGLHNYGFASGGSGEFWLNVFYLLMASIALVAFGFAWYDHEVKKMKKREKAHQRGNKNNDQDNTQNEAALPADL
ncbi:cytochrome c biogenesis protein CcsA [Akkermansiaceae bacterium]|nr:cytochrome c biogenesis protein CcsA [Akkermansiaceae bacterium]